METLTRTRFEVLDAKTISLEKKIEICDSITDGRETTKNIVKLHGLKANTIRKWIRLHKKDQLVHSEAGRPLKISKIHQKELISWAEASENKLTNKEWKEKIVNVISETKDSNGASGPTSSDHTQLSRASIYRLRKKIMINQAGQPHDDKMTSSV